MSCSLESGYPLRCDLAFLSQRISHILPNNKFQCTVGAIRDIIEVTNQLAVICLIFKLIEEFPRLVKHWGSVDGDTCGFGDPKTYKIEGLDSLGTCPTC